MRSLAVSLVFVGTVAGFPVARDVEARSSCAGRPPPPSTGKQVPWPSELPRDWKNEEGKELSLFNPATGEIELEFPGTEPNCPAGEHRKLYLRNATFDGTNLRGKMVRCTAAQELIKKCGMPTTFETDFYTINVTGDHIAGFYRSEWFDPVKDAKPGECPYVRNESGDGWCPFTLTVGGPSPCPDTEAVVRMNSAVAFTHDLANRARGVVTDPELRNAMSGASTALGAIQGVLGDVISAASRCKELHESMALLQRFENAVAEVNKAKCGRQLAAGFDHLFMTAGEVGEKFVRIPELKPVFQLLAANHAIYRDATGSLDPEQRWAAQFSRIDGYEMSNC
jgi:hypothetical protein